MLNLGPALGADREEEKGMWAGDMGDNFFHCMLAQAGVMS